MTNPLEGLIWYPEGSFKKSVTVNRYFLEKLSNILFIELFEVYLPHTWQSFTLATIFCSQLQLFKTAIGFNYILLLQA